MRPKIGIVGLPNVGKSTFLNLMTEKNIAQTAPWPFTTIDPNRGISFYDKDIFYEVAKKFNSKRIIFAEFEFIDVAGLIKDSWQGKGLGNQFLSHLKEADILVEIVRTFTGNVPHVDETIDPLRDHQIIEKELKMSDLKICQNNKKKEKTLEIIEKKINLNEKLDQKELEIAKKYGLFTCKEKLILANGDEKVDFADICFSFKDNFTKKIKIEILEKILEKLNLTYFVTANENETRINLIRKNANFSEAAEIVHSDFPKNLIKVQVHPLDDLNKKLIVGKNDKIIPESLYYFILK